MELSTALGLFLAFWSLLYLLDFYLRARSFQLYLRFVERTGLLITPFQVRWYTSRFQVVIRGWRCLRFSRVRRFLDAWFGMGVVVACVAMGLMVVFLSKLIFIEASAFFTPPHPESEWSGEEGGAGRAVEEPRGLIPIVPGVNVPWAQFPLLLAVLVAAGVWHELGHALAAMNEDVGVNGFGVFLLAIYPGAFTEIENESLGQVGAWRELKIYCGGIWHNVVMAAAALATLSAIPWALSPLYLVEKGVVVRDVSGASGLAGVAGLRPGHVVYGINYCKVYNEESWLSCLSDLAKKHYGYCVPRKEVAAARSQRVLNLYGELHCCGANSTQTHLCFYYKNPSIPELPVFTQAPPPLLRETRSAKRKKGELEQRRAEKSFNTSSTSKLDNIFEYSCLPARYVTDHYVCNHSLPCHPRTSCIYPALFNSTKLLRFFVANMSKPVLFVGFPSEVASLVSVSSFVPKVPWAPPGLPPLLQLCAKYVITFSLALALLNAVPCYSLDGQFILAALTRHRGPIRRKGGRSRSRLYRLLMFYGSALLVANILIALFNFARTHLF